LSAPHVLAMAGMAEKNFFFPHFLSPFLPFWFGRCSYDRVKCKHQSAVLFLLFLWKNHLDSPPTWAPAKIRTVLHQEVRVRLGLNLSWKDFLCLCFEQRPRGDNITLLPAPQAAAPVPPPAPLHPPPPAAPKKQAVAAVGARPKKRARPIYDDDDESGEDYNGPPRIARKRVSPAVEAKIEKLRKEAKNETDDTIANWLRRKYPKYAGSIAIVGKVQTLEILASLLVS